jgi:phospholipid transport system substrate-binding protein
MPNRFAALIFAFLVASAATPALANSPVPSISAAVGPVETLHDALLSAMRSGPGTGFEGRRSRINPAVQTSFDLPGMAQLMVGPIVWPTLKADEREAITNAIASFTSANYASQFKSFGGESFRTLGTQDAGRGTTMVRTQLMVPGDKPVAFNYRMRQGQDGKWRIIDILLDGTVSEVAKRRGEFAGLLKAGGAKGLVDALNARTSDLGKKK